MRKVELTRENAYLGSLSSPLLQGALSVGAIFTVTAFLGIVMGEDGTARFFHSYLVNFAFYLSLSLGALFFVMIHHRSRAGWSVAIRRVAEAAAANVVVLAVLFIPLLCGMSYLYPWAVPEVVEHNTLLQGKAPYLNVPFFVIRWVLYFAVWIWFANFFLKKSVEQDTGGGPELTQSMERLSAPGILLFALTVTFASFDLLMSLEPNWFSTIFGVYYFAGSLVGVFAFLPVCLVALQRSGRLKGVVTIEHYHDIGKYLFGFVVFWAYIAFSQFLLIWYGDIPEETVWYQGRIEGQWYAASLFLIAGHFALPFFALMSRTPKRRPPVLALACVWLLLMHWFDLYWIVMPKQNHGFIGLHWMDVAGFIGMGGFFVAGMAYWIGDRCLAPKGDPRLEESLAFENA